MADAGPIADLSYRTYEGTLEAPEYRWWVIAKMSIRLAIKKKLYWGMLIGSGWYYLAMIVILFFFEQISLNTPHGDVGFKAFVARIVWKDQFVHGFSFGQLPYLVITLLLGAGAIANDNRANALLVYLSKPCSKMDYLIGKWVGVALPLLFAMAAPALVFYGFGAMSYRDYGFLANDPWLLLRLAVLLPLAAAFESALILGFSSLFKQGQIAGAAYAALYFITNFFTQLMTIAWIVSQQAHGKQSFPFSAQDLFYASIDGVQIGMAKAILNTDGSPYLGIPSRMRAIPHPNLFVILAIVALIGAAGLFLAWRRIRAVEVVR